MALDFFAIVSNGVFPTPTPTGQKRAGYAVTWGLLGTLAGAVADEFVKLRDVVLRAAVLRATILRDINTGHRG